MNAGETNEFEANYNARVAKIRKAAAIALKELDRLRSSGFVTQEVLDGEVTRIAQEKLHLTVAILLFTGRTMVSRVF